MNLILLKDGFCYERSAILEWFDHGKMTSPMTNQELANVELVDHTVQLELIEEYLKSLDFDKFDVTPDLLG